MADALHQGLRTGDRVSIRGIFYVNEGCDEIARFCIGGVNPG